MQHGKTNSITLTLGCVRSCKSSFAQRMAEQAGAVTFVAKAEWRDDEEMQVKIDPHRAERAAHCITIDSFIPEQGIAPYSIHSPNSIGREAR